MVTSIVSRSFDRSNFYCLYRQYFYYKNCLYRQLLQLNSCLRIQFQDFLFSHKLFIKEKGRIKKRALHITKVQSYFSDANHKQLTGVGHGY